MAEVEEVIRGFHAKPGVRHTATFNERVASVLASSHRR
jgi:hypothetical protein